MMVYYAASVDGYKRGPYRATLEEAEDDCSASGVVRIKPRDCVLQEVNVPWDLVDQLFSSGRKNKHDGIEQVWLHTHDRRLMKLAESALRARDREVPWK